MTSALYDDGPAATYSNGTGDVCVCDLGVGTAPPPCPLHPPRHSPYGAEATATGCAITPPPTGPSVVIGAPGAPVIASREDAARVFGEGTDDYNLAVSALAYFESLPPPPVVKVPR